MTVTLLAPPAEIIHLSGISWKTYKTLLAEMSDRRLWLTYRGLPKNKLFMLKNNNHSRSVGGRGRWLPPPSNFVVELILYIINQVFLCKCIWN